MTTNEHVFYCDNHTEGMAISSDDDLMECPDGHEMVKIGWFQYEEGTTTTTTTPTPYLPLPLSPGIEDEEN